MRKSTASIRAFSAAIAIALATVSQPALAAYQAEAEPNDSMGTAQSLDGFFTVDFDPIITDSTSAPHSSIRAGTADTLTYDWYSFTVAIGGTQGLFDIDYGMPGMDSFIDIFDSGGVLLAGQDDGFAFDPGSENDIPGFDTYLSYIFATPGTYYLRVGECCGFDEFDRLIGLPGDGSYVLHASVGSAVPEPGTWAMMLLGFGATGLALRRRRPRQLAHTIA